MADSIGRIGGSNSYFSNNIVNQQQQEEQQEAVNAELPNVQDTQVDPELMMRLMNQAANIFAQPAEQGVTTTPAELAPDVQNRVVDSMEKFQIVYDVFVKELGSEALAQELLDIAMDRLM